MKILGIVKIAFNGLRANKLRTFLTVLGIVIGISAVIIVMSAGESIKSFVLSQVEAFGSDFIEVEVKVPNTAHTSTENVGGLATGVNITTLKIEDALEVVKHPNISDYYAGVLGQELVSYNSEIKKSFLFGVTSDFLKIDKGEIEQGRFFTESEDKSLSHVVVIGSKVKDRLFGESDALGKNIKINRNNYKVIGIMRERGALAFFDMDNMIFIPLRNLQKRIMGIDYISFFVGKLIDTDFSKQTGEDVVKIMRERHNITDPDKDDFAVVTSEEAQEMINTIIGAITLLLIALAAISLVVGGVGIMNIMYVSVAERTYEIGLRKAVGATKSNILWQFLLEAVAITLLGGLLGVILGIGVAFLIAVLATSRGFDWQFSISILSIALATTVAVAVGILFGIYPARRAANLNIVEALRYE